MADIMQEIEDAADRVSRGIDALKEENAELRAHLETAQREHAQFLAFHEAFAEECSKKIEAAERTISQLRAELEYERGK